MNLTLKLCMFIEKTPDLNLAVQRHRANEAMGPLTTDDGCQAKRHQNTSHQTCQTSKKTILPRQLTHFSEKLDEIAMIQDDQGAHVAGFRHLRKKKRLPKQVPRLLGKKTKCGMVSLRMARHNVNFYSAIVNFLNFTQLIGAWHSRVK